MKLVSNLIAIKRSLKMHKDVNMRSSSGEGRQKKLETSFSTYLILNMSKN